jgi:hypothetical protein
MLKNKAIIVQVTISTWSGRKLDRKATNQVEVANNASDAGNFNKLLIQKSLLDPITKIAGTIRQHLYGNSLAWGDGGQRIITVNNFHSFNAELMRLINKFNDKVQDMIHSYPDEINKSKARLGDLYNIADYPTTHEIKEKHNVNVVFMPISDENDVRINLSNEEVEIIRQGVVEEINKRLDDCVEQLEAKAKDAVEKMLERLSDSNATFRDSLFGNVRSVIESIKALNVTNNGNLNAVADRLNDLLVDPNLIRTNVMVRSDYANRAKAILDDFFN